ncbi:MAG: NACHT domain-containing protein [Spirulinaceae cyanobacterium]
MAKRSLKASPEGIELAKLAFERRGWTQEYLAGEVGLETRQPIWKFFSGRPVARHVFYEICFALDLDPDTIVEQPDLPDPTEIASGLEGIVRRVRSQSREKIEHQCGIVRLLDVSHPVVLDEIFVDVNVLTEIPHQQWLDVADLQSRHRIEEMGLTRARFSTVSGLDAIAQHPHLVILGQPGAGKTTFLQSIALKCIRGQLQPSHLPVFLRLKNLAEEQRELDNYELFEGILAQFHDLEIDRDTLQEICHEGRLLLLLDGLDELPQNEGEEIIKQIGKFCETYYKNQVIISCRPVAYRYQFRDFTAVEIADFNNSQVAQFVKAWFKTVAQNPATQAQQLSQEFLDQLRQPQNRQIRELASTPILLNLTCLVFQSKKSFPALRVKLYEQGLDILLVRWDESRGIQRANIYQKLSLPLKVKLLSKLATQMFEHEEYFLEQTQIKNYISDCLKAIVAVDKTQEELEHESEIVLKSIESQHGLLIEQARGIYSFSHLSFQEYLTSREIVANPSQKFPELAQKIAESRWREVFLLTAGMTPTAADLLTLMQGEIQQLIASSSQIQTFLTWVEQKAASIPITANAIALRAFCFNLALGRSQMPDLPPILQARAIAQDLSLDRDLHRILSQSDLTWTQAQFLAHQLATQLNGEILKEVGELKRTRLRTITDAIARELETIATIAFSPSFEEKINDLKQQLPKPPAKIADYQTWWTENGKTWVQQLQNIATTELNCTYQWQWSEAEIGQLRQFDRASQLLKDCIACAKFLPPETQADLERKLLIANT